MIVVDTCVFSLAFRRARHNLNPNEAALRDRLSGLVQSRAVVLLGAVRQELLSGLREKTQLKRVKRLLLPLAHPQLIREDFEQAAECHNRCRARGLAGSPVDFLICGVSLRRGWPIWTTDRNFARFARVLPLRLLA